MGCVRHPGQHRAPRPSLMRRIFEDLLSRRIEKPEEIDFQVDVSGLFLIEISARAKSAKQIDGTDDEDLRVEINGIKFPQLKNPQRYLDSPSSFSGGQLKNLRKSVYFLINLEVGNHVLGLIPDVSATLEAITICEITNPSQTFEITLNSEAEDGNRRSWVTFALIETALQSFTVTFNLKRRFIDSDDVKVIIDGEVKRNLRSLLHKFWYFIASLFGEEQTVSFGTNLASGLHYLEFWADRSPIFKKITFSNLTTKPIKGFNLTELIQRKIRTAAKENGLDPELMVRLAKRESQFNPRAVSSADAQGIFQLRQITIDQINKLGYQITDPFNYEQNIRGGIIYFHWLLKMYKGQKNQMEKTLAAWNWGQNNFPKDGPLDSWNPVPDQTKNFIKYVLNK